MKVKFGDVWAQFLEESKIVTETQWSQLLALCQQSAAKFQNSNASASSVTFRTDKINDDKFFDISDVISIC